ncbi:MAG: hypothetical protein IMW97_06610 [Firmicutes bacterium]|nr:hypothetical protein [Candidatus Fermentithermobacillaceae bacterium]
MGVVVGMGVGTAFACFRAQSFAQELAERKFRKTVWLVGEHFCPKGYHLLGKPSSPDDRRGVVSVPQVWYDKRTAAGAEVPQESLAWVNDEHGFAIVVHMVPMGVDMGRGPLAFPIANATRGPDIFEADYHFVGARDDVLYFFHMVPVSNVRSPQRKGYPREWVSLFKSFVIEFREFLDVWANDFTP